MQLFVYKERITEEKGCNVCVCHLLVKKSVIHLHIQLGELVLTRAEMIMLKAELKSTKRILRC